MAEAERQRRIQNVHDPTILNYGHLGTATYHQNTQSWSFIRQNQPSFNEDSDSEDNLEKPRNNFPLFKLRYQQLKSFNKPKVGYEEFSELPQLKTNQRALLDTAPELSLVPPEIISLSRLEVNSNDIFNGPSNRIAFGSAVLPGQHGRREPDTDISIAVTTTGVRDEAIRIIPLVRGVEGWEDKDESHVPIHAPTIGYDYCLYEMNTSGKIQQLVFCRDVANNAAGNTLAVRQGSATTIFQPMIFPHLVSVEEDEKMLIPLMANPVLAIPSSRTGGHPHADVAFHPEDSSTIAIVDTHGNWSIWRLSGKRSITARVLYKANLQLSGKLFSWDSQRPPSHIGYYYDGWHSFTWIRDDDGAVDKFLVCNRQVAGIYDILGNLIGYIDMRLGPRHLGNWILDIKPSAAVRDFYFILTSSHLLVMKSSESAEKRLEDGKGLEIICCWNHFRNRADLSLRISLLEGFNSNFVFLYSRNNQIVTMYQFGRDPLNRSQIVSLSDPVPFIQHERLEMTFQASSDLAICPLQTSFHLLGKSLDNEMAFFKIFLLGRDGDILEAMFQNKSTASTSSNRPLFELALHLPTTRRMHLRSAKYVDIDDMDDFVVDDEGNELLYDFGATDSPQQNNDELLPTKYFQQAKVPGRTYQDWQDVLDLQGLRSLDVDVSQALQTIQVQLRAMAENYSPLRLLSDIATSPHISDIDEESKIIDTWFGIYLPLDENEEENPNLDVALVSPTGPVSLLAAYNELLDNYLYQLQSGIYDRVRINRERLARRVATDLLFSSLTIRSKGEPQTSNRENEVDPSEPRSPGLYSSSGKESNHHFSDQISSSPPEPRVPASEADQTRIVGLSSPISRLSRYTKIIDTDQTARPKGQSPHSESMAANIISHLPTTLTDPSQYSYEDAESRFKLAQHELATQSLDPRTRRRAEKQAQARRRKLERLQQQREVQTSQLSALPSISNTDTAPSIDSIRQIQSSQAYPISYASIGTGNIPTVSSPSPGLFDPLNTIMTQPERGVFGERVTDAQRKKIKSKGGKKKRKGGF